MRPLQRLRTARLRRTTHPVGIDDAVAAVAAVLRERTPAVRTPAPDDRFEALGLDSVDVAECVIALELVVGAELELGEIEPIERVRDLMKLRRVDGSVGP